DLDILVGAAPAGEGADRVGPRLQAAYQVVPAGVGLALLRDPQRIADADHDRRGGAALIGDPTAQPLAGRERDPQVARQSGVLDLERLLVGHVVGVVHHQDELSGGDVPQAEGAGLVGGDGLAHGLAQTAAVAAAPAAGLALLEVLLVAGRRGVGGGLLDR